MRFSSLFFYLLIHNGISECYVAGFFLPLAPTLRAASFRLDAASEKNNELSLTKRRFLMLKGVYASIQKGDNKAIEKAEAAVQKLLEWDDKDHLVQGCNLLIHALARAGKGEEAEAILDQMTRVYQVEPNVKSYTSVMDAYAHQAQRDPDAPNHAERILFDLIRQTEQRERRLLDTNTDDWKVTSITCDVVINAWAQLGSWDGACRAKEILDRLEVLSKVEQENGRRKSNSDLKPSQHSYASVISAFGHSQTGTEGAEQAEELLQRMKSSKSTTKPDTVVYNAVIHAWANSRDPQAGTKAVALLGEMDAPDVVTYNTVMHALSQSSHMNASKKAEQVLQQMIREHKENPGTAPAPNTITFNSVLNAMSKSKNEGIAKKAQTLLDYMVSSGDQSIFPDVYSFTSALNCVAKSKDTDKAVKARAMLDQMVQLYTDTKDKRLKPTHVPFNVVINAAAFSAIGTSNEEKKMAMKIAVQTFALMRHMAAPDTLSYGNLLKAMANLMPQGKKRTEMALQVFSQCCKSGLVGDLVWKEARRAIPGKAMSEATGLAGSYSNMSVQDLPPAWTINCKQTKSFQRKKRSKNKKPKSETKAVQFRRVPNIAEMSYQSGRDC